MQEGEGPWRLACVLRRRSFGRRGVQRELRGGVRQTRGGFQVGDGEREKEREEADSATLLHGVWKEGLWEDCKCTRRKKKKEPHWRSSSIFAVLVA
ncbi:hypothetical protein LINPERPRIM_LOCUS23258 [Linum perenne]